MILPITAYGDPVLRKKGELITKDYEGLNELIQNMFDTMYNANGVGLAAPQVGKSLRLFIADGTPFAEDEPEMANFKKVFINPTMLDEDGQAWKFNEGCLSIPGIREDILRKPDITLRYFNEQFEECEEQFTNLAARIIQHEYDHIEGILFTDKISPIKRRLLKNRLDDISKGKADVDYKLKFYNKR